MELDTKDSARLLAETFYPEDSEEDDSEEHRRVRVLAEQADNDTTSAQGNAPFTHLEMKLVNRSFDPKKAPACPPIISRDDWGGYDPFRDQKFSGPVDIVIIQHTATPQCSRDSTCKTMIRSIEDYHVDTLFYNSIGINFFIGGNAKAYEGAGWDQIGTHTQGYNNISIAISFIGNYEHDEPTDAQLKIAQELIKCGVEKKYLSPYYHLVGHRQLMATESPGRNLYRIIRGWNNFLPDVSYITCPPIVSRDDWGGYDPFRDQKFNGPVELVIIQHTDTPQCSRDSTCQTMIRGIEDYHVDTLYYNSIGMNFLIGGNDKAYEGAGWEQIGTHTQGYNNRSIAISFIGNYEYDEPTDAQLKIAQDLIKCGVEKKYLSPYYHLVGHRQLMATESPGRNLYRIIRGWNNFLPDVSSIRN